jgi:hypothetical protein
MDFDVSPGGVILPQTKLIVPGVWKPTRVGAEMVWHDLPKEAKKLFDRFFKAPTLKEKIVMMAGSLGNFSSKAYLDMLYGNTAATAVTTHNLHLYTSALDDTFTGATAGKANYTSYAVLQLTNNTTIFAAGSGTTTYTKTWPSDAAKTWATSTGGATPSITYLGDLDGNLGTSADHGLAWTDVTATTINNGDTPQLAIGAVTASLN